MTLLILGLGFLAGIFLADRLTKPPEGSKTVLADPRLKAQVGQDVAVFCAGQWGKVREVKCGADGDYRYVVGFANGLQVELLGKEITR